MVKGRLYRISQDSNYIMSISKLYELTGWLHANCFLTHHEYPVCHDVYDERNLKYSWKMSTPNAKQPIN